MALSDQDRARKARKLRIASLPQKVYSDARATARSYAKSADVKLNQAEKTKAAKLIMAQAKPARERTARRAESIAKREIKKAAVGRAEAALTGQSRKVSAPKTAVKKAIKKTSPKKK
jgi:hypothetical protein